MSPRLSLAVLTSLLALVSLLGSGCALARTTVNTPLDPAKFQQLVPGETTAREAVAVLGAPIDVVQLGHRSAYRYDFRAEKRAGRVLVVVNLFHEDTRTDRAWLFFDENDVLSHLGVTYEAGDAQYALPWNGIHDTPQSGE